MGRPKLTLEQAEARGALKRHPERYAVEREERRKQRRLDALGKPRDFGPIIEGYVEGVLGGEVVVGSLARAAVERHRRDREREREPDFPYEFRVEKAAHALAFVERMPHTKGRWAARKQKLRLEPWQCFWIGCLFGWVRKRDGMRRFRRAYVSVPRKNAKSVCAAAIGNHMMVNDEEHGAEIYSGATSEKQAWEVFGPARLMFEKSPELADVYGVEVWAKALVRPADNARFWPVIGKPGDGPSPHCAITDEYHEHATPDQVDTMITGMLAREQPLHLVITTAGTNLASPCYDMQLEVRKVLEGTVEDERLFAIIYTIDEGDDWASPDVLRKANPNADVSVDMDALASDQRQAVMNPSVQNRFKTKHLNVWCNASVAGINMHLWKLAGDKALAIEEFLGKQARLSLDLASKIDIAARIALFERVLNGQRHWYCFGRYYLPEDTIEAEVAPAERGNQMHYQRWVREGRLVATPGAEIDFDVIKDEVLLLKSRHQVVEITYDAWRATQLAHQLAAAGAVCVEFPQGGQHMAAGYDELIAALAAGRFHHDGCPVLEWMASNTVARSIAKGLVVPSKEKLKPQQKIDGIVALCMALSRAIAGEQAVDAQMMIV